MHIGGLVNLAIGGYHDQSNYKNRCPLLAQNLHENGFILLQISKLIDIMSNHTLMMMMESKIAMV
jgi:hypothetical protein